MSLTKLGNVLISSKKKGGKSEVHLGHSGSANQLLLNSWDLKDNCTVTLYLFLKKNGIVLAWNLPGENLHMKTYKVGFTVPCQACSSQGTVHIVCPVLPLNWGNSHSLCLHYRHMKWLNHQEKQPKPEIPRDYLGNQVIVTWKCSKNSPLGLPALYRPALPSQNERGLHRGAGTPGRALQGYLWDFSFWV